MAQLGHRGRRWFASAAGLSLIASGLGLGGMAAAAAPGPQVPTSPQVGESASIEPAVTAELEQKGSTDFWVRFEARPDSSAFASIGDWDARGKAVYEAYTSVAEESQAATRAMLDEQGVQYEAFWATNSIRITGGDSDLVTQLAATSGVEGIYEPRTYEIPDEKADFSTADVAPAAVEWGVADINADDVWSTYGAHGEGITVASIDTGVQYDHPALVDAYRGNNGDGTFDHDYNWYDAQGSSPHPIDYDGHGSHVTGTMAGDDGAGNQIGVAPGATWIAASGCCPSDAALVNSGQWMLAPTRADGSDADTSKRPHVVNNSWGSTVPSNDPFMEDIIIAWGDAGIFGVFANGNSGAQGCESSGSPGSRIVAYSVGNYTSTHALANTSGKGYGQDGEIKPNISAPGTNVRSSVPGGGYANYSGTSMASPHVAGTVALLWSAAPSLVGDVTATRALLDGTAVDTEYATCGGTLDDNNGFGEGRLDALALIDNAPIGDTGTLAGTITDSATGEPIEGATIEVDGEYDRSLTSDANGDYSALLATGDYTITVSEFGYATATTTGTVTVDTTTTVDVALDPAPSATVSGTVTDGSGRGWPLYASILADGTPVDTFTDPETGEYSLSLPTGSTYTLQVVAQYPGYVAASEEVAVSGDQVVDFAVPVDNTTCVAPGYSYVVDGVTESFDGTETPEGWEVVDHLGNGQVWRFDNPDGRDNMTGGEGNFAILDSDFYGSGESQDSSLVSPSVDMSALTAPVVGFKHDLNYLSGDTFDVDVSTDGGATWSNVVSWQEDRRGPREEFLQLPTAAGQSDVKVRFHGYELDYDWWWEVDDVFIGNRECLPTGDGGLLVGNVYDMNTSAGIVGARVSDTDDEAVTAVTTATPEDDNLDDGFYWLFDGVTGADEFSAEARNYSSQTQSVTTVQNEATRLDFTLGAAFLEWTPESIETQLTLGDAETADLTVTNSGTGTAEIEFQEVGGDFELLRADGSTMTRQDVMDAEGAPIITHDGPTSFGQFGESDPEAAAPVGPSDDPWTALADYLSVVMDNRLVNLDGTWYSVGGTNGTTTYDTVASYDPASMSWTEVAPLPEAASAVTTGVVNGQIVAAGGWVSGGVGTGTYVYDAGSDAWTEGAEAPYGFSAAGQAVLDGKLYSVGGCSTASCTPMMSSVAAYDVATDSWEQLADYPESVAFASCAGLGDAVYCTGGNNGSAATTATYAYDPGADTWTAVASAPADTWASQYAGANGLLVVNGGVQGGAITNATMAYDPATDEWASLPASNQALYRGAAACGLARVGGSISNFNAVATAEMLPGFTECGGGAADVDWLSLSQTAATLAPGESVTVEVTTDGGVAQPGTYSGGVRISSNAPGATPTVPVTMVVDPPSSWGKLMGTVSGVSCDDGSATPLDGATVDITPVKGGHPGWYLTTDAAGSYAIWYDSALDSVRMIAAKDGWRPDTAQVKIKKGKTTVQDFALAEPGCEPSSPGGGNGKGKGNN